MSGHVVDPRRGPGYWRSIEEYLAREAELQPEFPPDADARPEGWTRRDFMKLLGASMALAGVQGCAETPQDRIVPYVHQPPEMTPGVALHYATAMVLEGHATGLILESREGRPIKVEGNPAHPASLGASGIHEQASVLQLYDPHRARLARQSDRPRSWSEIAAAFGPRSGDDRAGLHFLLEPTSSPFRAELIERIRTRRPGARFHFHSALGRGHALDGARRVFGRPLAARNDLTRAMVVVALDSDLLAAGPFHLRYAHDFATQRRITRPTDSMNRLYVAEPIPTPTGGMADHRVRARASEIARIAGALLAAVTNADASGAAQSDAALPAPIARWIAAAAADLRANRGRSLVVAGEAQPPAVHAAAIALNVALGNVGSTVWFLEPAVIEAGEPSHAIAGLVAELEAGQVETLVIADANPAYATSPGTGFVRALARARRTLYAGLYENETARICEWFVPTTHYLESWGDARAYDGTLSPIQPLISPLYGGHSVDELLALFAGEADRTGHDLLREFWRGRILPAAGAGADFEAFWESSLRRGVVPGSEASRITAAVGTATVGALLSELGARAASIPPSAAPRNARENGGEQRIEVALREDPKVYDGRFANNAWLQELPDPITKLTWDNAALLSPATAAAAGIDSGDVVRIDSGRQAVELPALIVPGHADDAVTLRLGYGRQGAEENASRAGVDAYALAPAAGPWLLRDAMLRRVLSDGQPVHVDLAITQMHWRMEGRDPVLEHTLAGYRADPDFTEQQRGPVETLYKGPPLDAPEQWAMTIDLSLCTGCSACVVACVAENNIPVVGRKGVLNSREMFWLRVDRYLTGTPDEPRWVSQPMLCQHCERAPCEYVCPVGATVHSPEGLNEMVYNRCVGTRFCSNNCPYKVRRFNWFDYNAPRRGTELLVLNPDVTVRDRGVMEKCTYCVQRIRRAEIAAHRGGHASGVEVVTACQQACPTRAIVFGSLTDEASELAATRKQQRIYSVLHDLGTVPRTQYLARITNPNPAVPAPDGDEARSP